MRGQYEITKGRIKSILKGITRSEGENNMYSFMRSLHSEESSQ